MMLAMSATAFAGRTARVGNSLVGTAVQTINFNNITFGKFTSIVGNVATFQFGNLIFTGVVNPQIFSNVVAGTSIAGAFVLTGANSMGNVLGLFNATIIGNQFTGNFVSNNSFVNATAKNGILSYGTANVVGTGTTSVIGQ